MFHIEQLNWVKQEEGKRKINGSLAAVKKGGRLHQCDFFFFLPVGARQLSNNPELKNYNNTRDVCVRAF